MLIRFLRVPAADVFAARVCSLGLGDWALQFGMSRACRLVRAYGRFAWQAWGIVAAYIARRWIAGWRFAWQGWGMVDDACVKKTADVYFAWQAWGSGCMSVLRFWRVDRVAGVRHRAS